MPTRCFISKILQLNKLMKFFFMVIVHENRSPGVFIYFKYEKFEKIENQKRPSTDSDSIK